MDENKCPKCGALNEKSIKDCNNCGYTIAFSKTNENLSVNNKEELLYTKMSDEIKCTKCDYPILSNQNSCPNCGSTINSQSSIGDSKSIDSDVQNIENPQTENVESKQNENKHTELQKTIDIKSTMLDPNQFYSEKKNLETEEHKIKMTAISLNGSFHKDIYVNEDEKTLGRADIDLDDTSLSGNHIKIFKEQEQWKIENLASNQATFHVVRGIANLNDGDIILLGNGKFYRIDIKE